ncbi:1594_t:CDS:10 [Paraglomus brasilianum]|uniref:1594_t:CDS:1 n=1 Tax=Paraglomus brasilianum TaxID=144538 RepID=A0A9N8WB11_9GLOM|nr:1594_t:CDS:10 [Paraglomus brasilianum]
MSFTSEEVNYLIYRYLKESESRADALDVQNGDVQPGALINLIQKGLLYMDIETHMNPDGTSSECTVPFTLIGSHKCDKTAKKHKREEAPSSSNKRERREERRLQKDAADRDRRSKDIPDQQFRDNDDMDVDRVPLTEISPIYASGNNQPSPPEPNGKDVPPSVIPSEDVITLDGHEQEVFVCSWNSSTPAILASGGHDATTRIWKIPQSKNSPYEEPIVLKAVFNGENSEPGSQKVVVMDWSVQAGLLAIAYADGTARIYTSSGDLRAVLEQHNKSILAIKWNNKGSYIATASMDKTAIVWDPNTANKRQAFDIHQDVVMDIDWLDDMTFATCSRDHKICICQIGVPCPLKTFIHDNAVHSVAWDLSNRFLASCSDDCTAKIWSMTKDEPIHSFTHPARVFVVQWCPIIKTTRQQPTRFIATTCADAVVRIWDVIKGELRHELSHSAVSQSIAFSSDGKYLATASLNPTLCIWSVKSGKLCRTYKTDAQAIFDVCWISIPNGDKYRLAAALSNGSVLIVDVRL